MAKPVRRSATYEDVLAAPPHMLAEIIAGELILSSRPSGPHSSVASNLGEELGPPFKRGKGGPGGWIILDEPELHLEQDIAVPDLAGWKRERLPAVEDVAYFSMAPDWVCEVLSPSTEKNDRTLKIGVYARERVGHVWLVDSRSRTLEVLQWDERGWIIVGVYRDDERIRAVPFDAIELELSVPWSDLAG